MYGYEIPRYVREYQTEWRRFDRLLRVRRSLDHPGVYVVERKSKYLFDHPFEYGTDIQVQYKDDHRKVLLFWPCDITAVYPHLQKFDIQRMGAQVLARELQQREEYEREREDAAGQSDLEAIGSEAYDFLAWREGRRVAT